MKIKPLRWHEVVDLTAKVGGPRNQELVLKARMLQSQIGALVGLPLHIAAAAIVMAGGVWFVEGGDDGGTTDITRVRLYVDAFTLRVTSVRMG